MAASVDPGTQSSFLQLNADDQGGAIVVTSYVLIVLSITTTATRLIEAVSTKRPLSLTDGLITLATVFGLAQCIALNLAVIHGLGRHIASLSASDKASQFMALFSARIVAIIAMACAKTSVIRFAGLINPRKNVKRRLAITVTVGVWALFAVLSLLFQCGIPYPWIYTSRSCHHGALVFIIALGNLLTDLYISIFFIPTIWGLHMKRSSRMAIAAFFLSRLMVCVGAVAELAVYPSALSAMDQTWAQISPVIAEQVVLNLSLVTANIVALKRLLKELPSGQMGLQLGERHGYGSQSSSSSVPQKSKRSQDISSSYNTWSWRKLISQHSEDEAIHHSGGTTAARRESGIMRQVDITVQRDPSVGS